MHYALRNSWLVLTASALLVVFVANTLAAEAGPTLVKEPNIYGVNTMECTPIVYQGQQLMFRSYRVEPSTQSGNTYLELTDVQGGRVLSKFGDGYSLGCAYVDGGTINVYASLLTSNDWFHDIYRFTSTDTVNWTKSLSPVVTRSEGEHLLNSSVCQDPQGYLMAYESDKPVGFCFKFARSTDLATWQKLDVPTFAGPNGNEYSACPVIRYCAPYYYAIYLHAPVAGHTGWISYITRSRNLTTWEYSPKNPILEAGTGEGCNNSDVDLIEIDGQTFVYYAIGDQQTWCKTKRAVYDGTMQQFFQSYFEVPEPSSRVLLSGAALAGLARYCCHRYGPKRQLKPRLLKR